MNIINHNGQTIIHDKNKITVDGIEYLVPDYVNKVNYNSLIAENGIIRINGYIFNPNTGSFNKDYSGVVVNALIVIIFVLTFYCFYK